VTVTLEHIRSLLHEAALEGDPTVVVHGATHDSRLVQPGWLFVAMQGEKVDGHDFIDKALAAGAVAVLAGKPRDALHGETPWLRVKDPRQALGPVSAEIYGRPTGSVVLVGITGTNGKTTLTFLLEAIVKASGGSPGVVGTVSHRWGTIERTAANTTPEASDLQLMFKEMVAAGTTHVLMEVSSHGLHRGRLEGCDFDLGVFTNLTHDHLDYHGTLEDYYKAKRMLFDRLLPNSVKADPRAVVNLDDPYGRRLAEEIGAIPVFGFGTSPDCAVHPSEVFLRAEGISATLDTPRGHIAIESALTGPFNLSNILAAVAVAERLGLPDEAIQKGIAAVKVVPGRLERIDSDTGSIFVDYAHTPNALRNVLEALQMVRTGRIITVMGCGGDRDKTKRPVMGREAATGSDVVVVTSDNPRTEEPMEIIGQVEAGVKESGFSLHDVHGNGRPPESSGYTVICDRREAIAWAVKQLRSGDILLVAGKGHETYQEINGVRHPFDDREVIRDELKRRGNTGHRTPCRAGDETTTSEGTGGCAI
jgi:UDP-N-acetylmuramoyl-L-alanyl-D-glutamate--2,6-diaminopimelate ligase